MLCCGLGVAKDIRLPRDMLLNEEQMGDKSVAFTPWCEDQSTSCLPLTADHLVYRLFERVLYDIDGIENVTVTLHN